MQYRSAKTYFCQGEAEVYGKDILMWLLGQGKWVELLSPASLRQEMKETLTQMLAQYPEQ